MDPNVTQELIETRKDVRQKYLNLKRDIISETQAQERALEPVSKPLAELLRLSKNVGKVESPIKRSTPASAKRKLFLSPRAQKMDRLKQGLTVTQTVYPYEPKYHSVTTYKRPGDKGIVRLEHSGLPEHFYDSDLHEKHPDDEDSAGTYISGEPTEHEMEDDVEGDERVEEEEEEQIHPFVPYSKNPGGLSGAYLTWSLQNDKEVDKVYGIRGDAGKFQIGNSPITIENDIITLNDGSKVQATNGLLELLIKKEPNENVIKTEDWEEYKRILEKTSAYTQNYVEGAPVSSNKGVKYKNVIKKLFPPKTGGNLVYWRDPNQLCERLKLLLASQSAGHNHHGNEITMIISELIREGYIRSK